VTAEDLLARFVPGGVLDESIFKSIIGSLIENAKASVTNGHASKVRVFGEMLSKLRGKGLIATTRLEELWNEMIRDHALHHAEDRLPEVLEQLHSESIEREP
jgi:hypothetical protein